MPLTPVDMKRSSRAPAKASPTPNADVAIVGGADCASP
jgi:hypothetical protein